jgi:peptidoglycan hydrolase-like protein with peptidoglycan-binding domain
MKMKTWIAMGFTVSLTLACSHTQSVGPTEEPEKAMAEAKSEVKAEPPKDGELASKDAASATTPSSPTALLKPGGANAIQDKLAGKGELNGAPTGKLDGPTRAALARFQRANDLPATGLPDDATVQKLGLKPEDVFRPTGAGAP